ncbi:MAG: COR domain-containing protein [Cyanobacteria bacterium J06634_5]
MAGESKLHRIAPEVLPELLSGLDEKTTELVLIGPLIRLPASPDDWPEELQRHDVYQLSGWLSELPYELLKFEWLQVLILRDLRLKDVDVFTIAKHLGQLTSLDLSNNQVSKAGAKVIAEHLGQLTSLDLSNNQVGDVGAQAIAEHLGQLTYLGLSSTSWLHSHQVSKVGAQAIAEHLRQLTSLDLSNNRVGDAGAQVIAEHLKQLTSLNLFNNEVGNAGARVIAEHLKQLTLLNLRKNQVSNEAVAVIGQSLTNLVTLNLQGNEQITTIDPLAQLPLLLTLDIAETGVADLSPLKSLVLSELPVKWSSYASEGPGIYIEDCPLTYPPLEIAQQGPDAVFNFFQEIGAHGVEQLFEAKLLIVGEGGAGKTSLLRRMFLPDMGLPLEEATTRGIDIHRHEFSTPNGPTFRLNTWDFGGQQIYHATHQFFLTKRSLYVLVDDTRSDNRSIHDEGFRFWLEVVETLSEASPLLIFQNEKGGRSKDIDEAGIKGRFPNVKDIHKGNLEHPDAANSLCEAVEHFAKLLPHIGEDVPAKWVAIRNDLKDLAQDKSYISLSEYCALYKRHLEFDEGKALKLSQYLHDLGVFLHFHEPRELRRTVFLQNQWVTDAVFCILDDKQVKAQRGRFTLTDCDRLWSDQGFADKEIELRALMIRFELCYRLPDTTAETWLVPQHLSPSKPPALSDWASTSDLMLTYRYEFLPRGLVSRLIVRMHRFVTQPDLCWANGAVFSHGDTQVLVETTLRGNAIALRSRGPEKKSLLSVIASDLDALNDSFQGLKDKVGKWVPCICDTCASLKEPALFEQKRLIERKHLGRGTIECPTPPDYNTVSVLKLLDGMNLERWLEQAGNTLSRDEGETTASASSERSKPDAAKPHKTIRIFLASSAELREDRDAFDLYFRQQNDRLLQQGLYLEIVRWENFLDAMSNTRLQDEYNTAIQNCDVFVSLFKTKTGKYTEEEFDVAHKTFQETNKPLIYTYFQKAEVSTSPSNKKALMSLWDFQEKLEELGHFWTEYDSIEGLKRHFRDQLDDLQDDERL